MLRFKDLQKGDRFRFVYGWPLRTEAGPNDTVHVRAGGRGYYDGTSGKRFETGSQVTVELTHG